MMILTDNGKLDGHCVRHVMAYKQPSNLKIVAGNDLMLQHGKLVLTDAETIAEYLDEVIPHPLLLPVYPAGRAVIRNLMQCWRDVSLAGLLKDTPYLYSCQPTLLDIWVINTIIISRSAISQKHTVKEAEWIRRMLDSREYKLSRSTDGNLYEPR